MAKHKKHLSQAKYNRKFYEDIKHTYQDWAITGLFYAALHLVDAYLAQKGISVEDHKTRHRYLQMIKDLKPIYPDYRALYDHSVNARYKFVKLSTEEIVQAHDKYFVPLEKKITKLLTPKKKKS